MLFTLATIVPRWLVADPQFNPIFAVNHYEQTGEPFGITFHGDEGRIVATVTYHHNGHTLPRYRLFAVDPRIPTTQEIAFTIPQETKARLRKPTTTHDFVSEEVIVDTGKELSIIAHDVAPDGYRHRKDTRSGLFGEVFGMRGSRNLLIIEKGGRIISTTPPSATGHYTNVQLIGWTMAATPSL